MKENNLKFPKIDKALTDFLNDEDGNIARNKLVSIGSLILLMSIFYSDTVFAHGSHVSHSSHSSHESHSSTSYIRDHTNHSSHSNHGSHTNHGSHSSHNSHTSHSNTSSHSNSLYSEEGDVKYGPKISEIPEVSISPIANNEIIDIPDTTDISATETAEANTSLLNMDIPEIPTADDVEGLNDTDLQFKNSTLEEIVGAAAFLGGAGAVTASGVGAAKIAVDKVSANRKKARAGKSIKTYSDKTVEKKLNDLKEVSDLEVNKEFLKGLSNESAFECKGVNIDACIEKIDNLKKAVEQNPEQKESIDRFTSYFIPETIGILMTYVQYVKDDAPEDDQNTVLRKATESIDALIEALDEKIDNIYQYSTMETVAKADALNKILTQSGFKKKEENS